MATASRIRLSRLLIAAAVLHLSFAIAVNLAGRFKLLPGIFDERGIGISFAIDSSYYLVSSQRLVNTLEGDGIGAWAKDSASLHVKLYSLSYAVMARFSGYNTLGAEPLNLLYYLLTLTLVFALGREAFERGAGILAAMIAALWPSFLLHTTQLLRDPLFLIVFLIIILICMSWLTRSYSWRAGLLTGIAGGAASALVWLVRSQMWEVMLCATLLAAGFLALRLWRERRFAAGNLISAALLCSMMISAPIIGKVFKIYSYPAEQAVSANKQSAAPSQPVLPPGSPLPERISFLRQKFLSLYPGAGSNIDTHVEFHSLADILLYLPRALAIGLFSPFPNMWFVPGAQVGLEGRLLSGFETFLIYLIEALAAFALWRTRRRLPPWLLLLIILTGLLALGLVVPNLAALYRMRFGFWLLLIILGAEGLRQFLLQISQTGNKLDQDRLL